MQHKGPKAPGNHVSGTRLLLNNLLEGKDTMYHPPCTKKPLIWQSPPEV